MPYRTLDDKIDGVVITFLDITAGKVLEENLLMKIAQLESQLSEIKTGRH